MIRAFRSRIRQNHGEDHKTVFIQVNNWGRDDPIPPLTRHRRPPDRGGGTASGERHRRHDDDPQQPAHEPTGDRHLQDPGDGGTADSARPDQRDRICSSVKRRSGSSSADTAWTTCAAWCGSTAGRRTRFFRMERSRGTARRPVNSVPRSRSRCLTPSGPTRTSTAASIRRPDPTVPSLPKTRGAFPAPLVFFFLT